MTDQSIEVSSLRRLTQQEIARKERHGYYELEAFGHSIWLMLDAKSNERIDHLISRVNDTLRTPYFEPHITLMGSIEGDEKEITKRASDLARKIGPFEVVFTKVEEGNNYFKTLYSKVEQSVKLAEANKEARKRFSGSVSTDSKYLPHLSLTYANFTSELFIAHPTLTVAQRMKSMEKIMESLEGMKAKVEMMSVYRTQGYVSEWVKVKDFKLKNDKKSTVKV